jgi:RNA polymerase sigma-70 factor, ECF subfamily
MPPNDQDRLTFEAAVEAFSESLYRVAFRLTGNHHTANELVQETYLGAWKNIAQLKDHTKLRGWLFAILRNQFSKICQRKKVNTSELGEIDAIPMTHPHSADLQETVNEAIQKLDDDLRLPILLVTMEGWSVAETADMLGIPVGTVLSRLHRGRDRLRHYLESNWQE